MDPETFYEALEWMDCDDRIHFLSMAEYDFHGDERPEALINMFYGISSMDDAVRFADTLRYRVGDIMIARESSMRNNRLMTVMDAINGDIWSTTHPGKTLIIGAMEFVGFKYAYQCDSR